MRLEVFFFSSQPFLGAGCCLHRVSPRWERREWVFVVFGVTDGWHQMLNETQLRGRKILWDFDKWLLF